MIFAGVKVNSVNKFEEMTLIGAYLQELKHKLSSKQFFILSCDTRHIYIEDENCHYIFILLKQSETYTKWTFIGIGILALIPLVIFEVYWLIPVAFLIMALSGLLSDYFWTQMLIRGINKRLSNIIAKSIGSKEALKVMMHGTA